MAPVGLQLFICRRVRGFPAAKPTSERSLLSFYPPPCLFFHRRSPPALLPCRRGLVPTAIPERERARTAGFRRLVESGLGTCTGARTASIRPGSSQRYSQPEEVRHRRWRLVQSRFRDRPRACRNSSSFAQGGQSICPVQRADEHSAGGFPRPIREGLGGWRLMSTHI